MATAIVYGEATGIIRRIVTTDDPTTLPGHIGAGEALLEVSDDILVPSADADGQLVPALDVAYAALGQAGVTSQLSRCLVIEDATAEVRAVFHADPTMDAVEGHTLYQDLTGDVGYSPDADGNFTIPPVAAPEE